MTVSSLLSPPQLAFARSSRATIAIGAPVMVFGAGLLVVAGWMSGVSGLASLFPGALPVKANAGVGLALLGGALIIRIRMPHRPLAMAAVAILAAVGGGVALLTLVEYGTGSNFGIDNWLLHEAPGAAGTPSAGRMAIGTALGLSFLAGAIESTLLHRPGEKLVAAFASLALTIGGISILGQLYGSSELVSLGAGGTTIAPLAAVCLAALAIGSLAYPGVPGPIDVLLRPTAGGRVARAFALATVTIVPALGLLRQAGLDAGLFGSGFGTAMVTAVGAVSLAGVGLRLADRLDRQEVELRGTSRTLRALLDGSPLAIIAVDEASLVTFWSRAAERMYGWTAAEVLGRIPPHIPDPNEALADTWRRVRGGAGLLRDEVQRRSKAGELIDVALHVVPLVDGGNRVVGLLTVQEDIRERKRLEAELLEAQKLQTVGRLAGGVAHNFNNILTAILGYTDLALHEPLDPEVRRDLVAVRSAADRAGALTHELLAYSRRQVLHEEPLDAGDLLRGLEPMLRQVLGADIELTIAAAPGVGSFVADPGQIEQVLLNLVLNARDAMPDGGRLIVRADHAWFDETSALPHASMAPGDYVLISVTDTGIGMDAGTLAHLFEPFFTTKEIGKGTGLGLSTSHGIVKQSGGEIVVESEPGQGSTFRLYFPVALHAPVMRLLGPAGRGRILVAEDDPMVRDLTRRALEAAGYDVAVAADGFEALLAFGNTGGGIDLLVTDVVMPRMRGTELARRLRRQRPDLPIVFMSGYNDDLGEDYAADHYLAKPFLADQLIAIVGSELAASHRHASVS